MRTGTVARHISVRELALLPFEAAFRCPYIWTRFASRQLRRGLGLMSELALAAVSAFPTNEVEAGFTNNGRPGLGYVHPY